MVDAYASTGDEYDLVLKLFAAVDAGDTEQLLAYLTEGINFRFGSAAPTRGKAALTAASRELYDSIARLRHEILSLWQPEQRTVVAELSVTYHRKDGSALTLPSCTIFRFDRTGLIYDYRIYMDVNPVFGGHS